MYEVGGSAELKVMVSSICVILPVGGPTKLIHRTHSSN